MVNGVAETLTGQAGLLTELLTSAVEPHLKKVDISLSTFELLTAIRAAGGKAKQVDIARRLGVTPPSLCEAVKAAVGRGLVSQVVSPTDARAKTLRLSPKGHSTVRNILEAVNQAEREMVVGIDPDELQLTVETLRRVNRNLALSLSGSIP